MDHIISPVATEKTMLNGQKENKLTFIVRKESKKEDVLREVEEKFNVKVTKVNILRTKRGKKAIVTLDEAYNAEEIGERIGIY
ncbi:MAG: 50S ribosomal protein L23 [Candidatus Thermoplasmatota archaeon]|jgi:large subunit ribosomal protein L23|nr:50S ribosomal protein L23 [Candidatus Thermoplasmatota archaeon]MCL5790604.1 50S ribosomal protein L23 [Candidatus Thermoplasmatota archaeon]